MSQNPRTNAVAGMLALLLLAALLAALSLPAAGQPAFDLSEEKIDRVHLFRYSGQSI